MPAVIPAKAGIQEGGSRGQVDGNGAACGDNPCVVIPAQAGMDCINHWIPRRPVPDAALPPASMQASLRWNDGMGKNGSEDCPDVSISLRSFQSYIAILASCRHSGEGRNPGNGAEVVNRRRVLEDGAFGCRSFGRHSRSAGMDYINHWIPAFAGMTAWARMTARVALMCLFLYRHSSAIQNPKNKG